MALLAGVGGLGHAQPDRTGQGGWERRACADPANFPFPGRQGRGFENHVAALLADELGARLRYAWLPLPRRDTDQELMLRMGACDLLLGVPDGQEPFLTTLAYYRSSAMFVRRADAPFELASLDDPVLADLSIGVQRGSPEDYALVGRGYIDNVRHFLGTDPRDVILRHVADGTLDLGIAWGPIAGYRRQARGVPTGHVPCRRQRGHAPRRPGADAVVLLLEAGAQLVFLGQYETAAVAAEAFGYPAALTQTRQFYAALAHDAPTTGSGPRVALWDSSLGSPAATELGERFLARWGQPMDPSAWAAYAAVKIVVDAVAAVGSAEPRELIAYLGKGGQGFDVLKGAAVSFGAADHQLRQPLYVVTLDPDAATLSETATVGLEVPEPAAPGPRGSGHATEGSCTP